MKDNLSLIYETSMEVRKALMDARIKKGSALTPEETKDIISKSGGFIKRALHPYHFVLDVSLIHVIDKFDDGVIDLSSTYNRIILGRLSNTYMEVAENISNTPQALMDRMFQEVCSSWMFDSLPKIRKNETGYIPEKDASYFACFDDNFKTHLNSAVILDRAPRYYYVNAFAERGSIEDGNAIAILFHGYASRKDNDYRKSNEAAMECETLMQKTRMTYRKYIFETSKGIIKMAGHNDLNAHEAYACGDAWIQFISKYKDFV